MFNRQKLSSTSGLPIYNVSITSVILNWYKTVPHTSKKILKRCQKGGKQEQYYFLVIFTVHQTTSLASGLRTQITIPSVRV